MKKTPDKTTAPKADAKPATKPATKATSVSSKARANASAASTKAPAAPAKAPAAATKKNTAPAKKKSAVVIEPLTTVISAEIDIGLGNHLFLRGAGPGLSWDRGLAMECIGPCLWTLTLKDTTFPILFKVLINDHHWSAGDDFAAAPGTHVTVFPTF